MVFKQNIPPYFTWTNRKNGALWNQIGSDLTGWTQFTSVNGFDSEYRDIKYGVPQGSVIDPLIFLIYINKLHHAIKFANYINLLISKQYKLK